MDKELIFGIIGFWVWCVCMVVSCLLLQKIYVGEMKKHYTIQVDNKVFIDIWALQISKFRRSVTFKNKEGEKEVVRHIFFDELHVMRLESEKQ